MPDKHRVKARKRNVWLLVVGLCWLVGASRSTLGQKPELIIHSGHSSAVENIWLSPDEAVVISQSEEKLIFWDLKKRQSLREVPNVKKFFVAPDSKTVVTLNIDHPQLDLWAAETGSYVASVMNFNDWCFSQDGKRLLSTHGNGVLKVRDLASNEDMTINLPNQVFVKNCLFGLHSEFALVSTDEDNGSVYVVNLISQHVDALFKRIRSWAVSPDGRFLVVEDRSSILRSTELGTRGSVLSQRQVFEKEGVS